VPMTRGNISQAPGQINREQVISQTPGGPGQGTMTTFQEGVQDPALNAAQERLRASISGGQPLTEQEAGTILKSGRNAAYQAADQNVDRLYQVAKDPASLAQQGITPDMPIPWVRQLADRVRFNLAQPGPGRMIVNQDFPSLAPNASMALREIERWQQEGLGPPGATRINWEGIDGLRQTLRQYQTAANAPNAQPGDSGAMQRIMQSFDQHFTPYNRLLETARRAHADQMSTFMPKGSDTHDQLTRQVLTVLDGPEGGAKVMHTIFGGGLKKGEAEQMIDHLNNQVLRGQPQAQLALKEQALRRLVVNDRGDALTPQRTVTALEKALDGDAERPIYERLFTADEMSRLQRFLDLQRSIANTRERINPPSSGLITSMVLGGMKSSATGASIGAAVGGLVGGLPGATAGAPIGAAASTAIRKGVPMIQAQRAINPPANYAPPASTGGAAPLAGGLLGAQQGAGATQQQPGLLDQFWQSQGLPAPMGGR